MWTGSGLEVMVQCSSAEMPSWREAGLFYNKPSWQHLDSNGFLRDPRAYLSLCLQQSPLQMKNLRSPSLTPQAVVEKLCLGPPGSIPALLFTSR